MDPMRLSSTRLQKLRFRRWVTARRTCHLFRSTLLAAVLSVATFAPSARADAAGEARMRYERAVKLYQDGAYDAALAEFNRAFELNPSFKVLYNVAQVRIALQDHAGALETFQHYLREGGSKVPEERIEAVRKELTRLEQRVARLTVQTDVSGAEVLIDEVVVGSTPLAGPLLVNSGMRRVTVRHPDHLPQAQRVSVAGGEQRKIALNFTTRTGALAESPRSSAPASSHASDSARAAPLPGSPGARSTDLHDADSSENTPAMASTDARPPETGPATVGKATPRRRATLLWSSWGTTAALALSTGALGIAALVANNRLDVDRGHLVEGVHELHHRGDTIDRLTLATDILLGASVAAAGVSLWLTLHTRPGHKRGVATHTKRFDLVRVALHSNGLSLRTEF